MNKKGTGKMRLPVLGLLALFALPVHAASVVGDVVAGVTSCGVVLDGGPKTTIPAVAGACTYNVNSVSNGSHTITMTAIASDPVWGVLESAPSLPFVFVKPAGTSAPASLRLIP
jgi:hypothetical protein